MTNAVGQAVHRATSVCFDPAAERLEADALRALQLERLKASGRDRLGAQRRLPRPVPRCGRRAGDIRALDDVAQAALPRKGDPCATPTRTACAPAASTRSSRCTARRARPASPRRSGHSRTTWTHWADAQRALDVDGRPAPGRPSAELLRLRPGDERRPAVRRAEGRHRRRAGRHRAARAAHRPHRRPGRDRPLHDAVVRPLPRRQGARARHRSRRDSRLRIGLFGAEPWPESGRERLADALGVEAFNEYGMGEFLGPGMACECPGRHGMHVWSDHLLVECIDPETGEWVADGEPGELVWTIADQRLDGHDPLPQPRHLLAHLGAVPVRPHPPADRPHHRAQRRRPLDRRADRVPQPDRGGPGAASTRSATTSAWSSTASTTSTG